MYLRFISFYLPLIYHFRSYRALIVFINGIIFHTNKQNNIIKNYDIFCNLAMTLWTNYNYPFTIPIAIFISGIFGLCMILKNKNLLPSSINNIIHLFFVQFPLSIFLRETLLYN